jgi:uncharacterized protein YuzE
LTITIGQTTFDRVNYDAEGDVLYLHVGDPSSAVDFDETPEGHALRFNATGELVGVTIVNARWLMEQDEHLIITLPERVQVEQAVLAQAIHAA